MVPPTYDCLACGACCREAFHTVEVHPRDRFARAHPERLVRREGRLHVRRAGEWCGCLTQVEGRYLCVAYRERPVTCRHFENGSENCELARKRVGLPVLPRPAPS